MMLARHCSKPGCAGAPVATLTYDYADSTAVLGPLSTASEPHAYDLCERHANNLTAPQGWQIVRLQSSFDPAPPSADDLMALVDAVRDAAHTDSASPVAQCVAHHAQQGDPAAPSSIDGKDTPNRPWQAERGPFAGDHEARKSRFHVITTQGMTPEDKE
ncbi:MAG: DUF3499 domain-containing protein [Actinomycetaceae bacterium]|nr:MULTISPECIES: DUF3499 domain-containing protein [Actinomycetaceae]MBS6365495.1 DUF3499 domain-containing protein [Actinomycetaceae bacterium]MDK6243188.1 DUF3499 domain-containing protein [Pauljensenia sp. UMB10120]MDU5115305.1 DUF3499 domain-containing protein [Actinomyces sp.]MDU5379268.1 DUF3499 domain-containing protein [Actinomyces sp.]